MIILLTEFEIKDSPVQEPERPPIAAEHRRRS